MGLRKTTESMTSIKQIKRKRRTRIKSSTVFQENRFSLFNDSIHHLKTQKPTLITYHAVPI